MQKSNVQDTIQPISGLISCPGVTGRWGLLSHAQNTYTFVPSSASIGTKLYPHGFLVLLQAQFNRGFPKPIYFWGVPLIVLNFRYDLILVRMSGPNLHLNIQESFKLEACISNE